VPPVLKKGVIHQNLVLKVQSSNPGRATTLCLFATATI
jgi:hypothetical protein